MRKSCTHKKSWQATAVKKIASKYLVSLCFSMNMVGVRNLLNITKHFTWTELPTRDSHTGSLTMAGWIQRIQPMVWRLNFCDWGCHFLYFVLRGVTSNGRPFFFDAWFPLDTEDMTAYVLALVTQVKCEFASTCCYTERTQMV
jgi:hypothetical protein